MERLSNKQILDRVLNRDKTELGKEIYEELLELYVGKEPKAEDILKEFSGLSSILVSNGNTQDYLKIQTMLEVLANHLKCK